MYVKILRGPFFPCFLKINLEVGIKLHQNHFYTFIHGCSIRVFISFINITLKQSFSPLALLTCEPDNSLLWNCHVYYVIFCSILGLYPLDTNNTHTR